ncbi:hypothetical protein B7P43_G09633 [Cryptotermes secundus]|uniref:Uncharacterized protein n=1 Tax=Cryptotermes secundus TaxID=105785 RepID=A0A2J7R7H7_9NEOP|nr:hypothetical protein B7P43_G09633 [Cryptotermes secundus]
MSSMGIRREALRNLLHMGVRQLCEEMVEQLRRRKKRKWVLDWIRRKDRLGASACLMRELAEEDPKGYRNIMRMAEVKFEELLEMVSPLIRKKDTVMREALKC